MDQECLCRIEGGAPLKVLGNILICLIIVSAFYALGFYMTQFMWTFVNWVGLDNFAVFAGIVCAIQGLGAFFNSKVQR